MRAAAHQNPEPKKPFLNNDEPKKPFLNNDRKRKALNPKANLARRNVRQLPTRQMNRGR